MKKLRFHLASAIINKHVSIPVVLSLLCEAGRIWLPHYANQFTATLRVLTGYALIAAANSGPAQPHAHKPTSK